MEMCQCLDSAFTGGAAADGQADPYEQKIAIILHIEKEN
jgi:hypothetical protein